MATLPEIGNEGDRGIYAKQFIGGELLSATYEGSWLYKNGTWNSDGFGRQITEPSEGGVLISPFLSALSTPVDTWHIGGAHIENR